MPEILNYILKPALAAFSIAADSWFSLSLAAQVALGLGAVFCAVIYFVVDHYRNKVLALKKDNAVLASVIEKGEKKFESVGSQKNKISKILFNLDYGMIMLDERDKIFLANLEAQRIIGVKTRDLEGMYLSELKIFDDLRPIVLSFSSLKYIDRKEIMVRDYFIEISVTKITLEDGKLGKIIVMRDITKERLIDKAKNDFLLEAIHQLKTAMSSVRWLIKMFLDGDFGKLAKGQKEAMKKLFDRNESIFPLIADMLNATKIDDGVYKYSKSSVNIEELAESSVEYFKDKIKSKKINFQFNKPTKDLPLIKADKAKIETVLQNLLDNALKYTPESGSITLSLKAGQKEIEFCIKDTGMGIPESQQPEIFSRFFRAKNAVRFERTGSGLGLFIAKKIVEDHNGRIWFNSKEGEGSEFCFTLPI